MKIDSNIEASTDVKQVYSASAQAAPSERYNLFVQSAPSIGLLTAIFFNECFNHCIVRLKYLAVRMRSAFVCNFDFVALVDF
jgi:hypothetical protein